MGLGTNVQDRLYAVHHLDAPWRPANIEQRDGRMMRRGNMNPCVGILRYVTQRTFDAYMWQVLEYKARMIAQIMRGDAAIRRVEDLETPVLTYAQMKALASGDPLVMQKAAVDAEVARLSRAKKAFEIGASRSASISRASPSVSAKSRKPPRASAPTSAVASTHPAIGSESRSLAVSTAYAPTPRRDSDASSSTRHTRSRCAA